MAVTGVPIPDTAGPQEFAPAIQAAGAADADVFIPLVTIQGCIGTYDALEAARHHHPGRDDRPVLRHPDDRAPGADRRGRTTCPDGWYFGGYGYGYFIPGNPEIDAYLSVIEDYGEANGIENIEYTGFAGPDVRQRAHAREVHERDRRRTTSTPDAMRQAALAFTGPMYGVVGPDGLRQEPAVPVALRHPDEHPAVQGRRVDHQSPTASTASRSTRRPPPADTDRVTEGEDPLPRPRPHGHERQARGPSRERGHHQDSRSHRLAGASVPSPPCSSWCGWRRTRVVISQMALGLGDRLAHRRHRARRRPHLPGLGRGRLLEGRRRHLHRLRVQRAADQRAHRRARRCPTRSPSIEGVVNCVAGQGRLARPARLADVHRPAGRAAARSSRRSSSPSLLCGARRACCCTSWSSGRCASRPPLAKVVASVGLFIVFQAIIQLRFGGDAAAAADGSSTTSRGTSSATSSSPRTS